MEHIMDFGTRKPPAPTDGMIGGGAAAADIVKVVSTATFSTDVLETSRSTPVLVDFWSPRAVQSKQLSPLLEKVVLSYGGKVKLCKMNVDEHPSMAGQLRIQGLPTVYAFVDGRPIDGFQGLLPEAGIMEFIDRLVGPDAEAELAAALAAAEDAMTAGDLQGAAEIFGAILEASAEEPLALAGLARCYLKSGDIDRAATTLDLVPPDSRKLPPVVTVAAAIELARKVPVGGTADLEAKVAANPADHQARIDLAVAFAAMDNKEAATEQLLTSFRKDRNWNEQAARKQLVQFFEAWGPKDPATIDGRKRLSSLMFS
jgi:putative thioredoxin